MVGQDGLTRMKKKRRGASLQFLLYAFLSLFLALVFLASFDACASPMCRRAEAGFATVRGALVIGEAPQLRLLFSEIFKTE